MRKILLIPDSFKGTMSSSEICEIMEQTIKKHMDAAVVSIPVADGGEGSVDAFLSAVGGEKRTVKVKGPFFETIESFYGVINKDTAVIEMAACAGLPLVGERKDPLRTTTFGVGQLMEHAVKAECKKIIMGLGGSCTNDAGAGCAAALGVKFYNQAGESFIPVGGTLQEIVKIDTSAMLPELRNTEVITMCDIDNPLYGTNGAAYVFAPQKGGSPEAVEILDGGLKQFADVVRSDLHVDVSALAGAGAAGGMGGGMVAFFNSQLQMGIETVLHTVKFDELLQEADLVFTGEGKIDSQSIRGKVVIGVANHTQKANVPLIAVVGDIGDQIEEAYNKGVSAIFSINRVAVDFAQAKPRAKNDLRLTMDNILRFIKAMNAVR